MRFRFISLILCTAILVLASFGLCSCSTASADSGNLNEGVTPNNVAGKVYDNKFVSSQFDFAVELFKNCNVAEDSKNVLISPLSVQLALAMTANGAAGETRTEIEQALGGNISLEDLNKYLFHYANRLKTKNASSLHIASSIWFRDNGFKPNTNFLQTNADYYGASLYKKPFDASTVKEINDWVNVNTDSMIDKIIESLSPDDVMCLINAVSFDGQWQTKYNKKDVRQGVFITAENSGQSVPFMYSTESIYLESENATGFIKNYSENKFSFAALLPNEGVSIDDYVASLDGDKLRNVLKSASYKYSVSASIPKFETEYSLVLNNALQSAGIQKAFDPINADFSNLGTADANFYVGEVLHKTAITVNEEGTKAAAVTDVTVKLTMQDDAKTVYLNRPFVYMIIDNETNLPMFIGVIKSI